MDNGALSIFFVGDLELENDQHCEMRQGVSNPQNGNLSLDLEQS